MINSALLATASRQFGVVSRTQLRELGISTSQLSRARSSGLVIDVTSRTVRVRSSPDTFLSRCAATSLHLGNRGVLAGSTAGRLHGLREMQHAIIEVVVPAQDRPNLPRWIRIRRSNWFDASRDRQEITGGIAITEPHRMLYDLAARLDDRRFQRAAEDCWHLGLVTPTSAAAYLRCHRQMGKDGTLRMQRWLDQTLEATRPTESGLELDLLEALRSVGLPEPIRQHQLRLPGGKRIRVDFAWPDIRLCVEPGHSWWHGGNDGLRRDNERKLECLAIGWETIQLDESLRSDPAQTARMIRTVYQRRARLVGVRAASEARSSQAS